jgi:hypothetical protein
MRQEPTMTTTATHDTAASVPPEPDVGQEGPIQGMLDFESGNPDGIENWRRQREARLEAVRREWSLPVGRRVRVRLRNIDGDFVGMLRLAEEPAAIDRRVPLRLRIDQMDFTVPEIERCALLD